jgi:hypothetical protein
LEQRAFLTPMPDHERFRKLRAGQWQVAFEKARAGRRTPAKAEALTTEADRLVEALIERGVAPGRAMEIVAVHPPDRIRAQLEVFDWLVTRKDLRLARNPAGFLISSIQGNYATPREYVRAKEQQAEVRQIVLHRQRREMRQRQTAAAEELQDQARRKTIEQFWQSLAPKERQRQEQAALAHAPALQRTLLARRGPFASVTRQAILDAYALNTIQAQGAI